MIVKFNKISIKIYNNSFDIGFKFKISKDFHRNSNKLGFYGIFFKNYAIVLFFK